MRVSVQIRRKCVLPKLPYIVIPTQLVDSDGRETWMKVSAPGSGWLGLARGRVWRTAVWRLHGPTSNYTPPGALCLNIQSCHLARSGYQTSDWCGDRSKMLLVVTTRTCQRLSWTRNIFEISILFCCGLCAAASSRWVRYVLLFCMMTVWVPELLS